MGWGLDSFVVAERREESGLGTGVVAAGSPLPAGVEPVLSLPKDRSLSPREGGAQRRVRVRLAQSCVVLERSLLRGAWRGFPCSTRLPPRGLLFGAGQRYQRQLQLQNHPPSLSSPRTHADSRSGRCCRGRLSVGSLVEQRKRGFPMGKTRARRQPGGTRKSCEEKKVIVHPRAKSAASARANPIATRQPRVNAAPANSRAAAVPCGLRWKW